jgi:hypothetical protein
MSKEELQLLTSDQLEDLLIDLCHEFHRRGWVEEDMSDEIRSIFPEDSDDPD